MTDSVEKRKHPRGNVKEGLMATLEPGRGRSGQIENISQNGLAFKYLTAGDWASEDFGVNISTPNEKLSLSNVPCKYIYDILVDTNQPGLMQWHQHGVEFGELNPQQKEILNHIIQDYATQQA